MKEYGFIRVGAIVPKLYLANPRENAKEIVKMLIKADQNDVNIVTTPELALTGYTCGDLFLNDELLTNAETALKLILEETKKLDLISIIGMPLRLNNQLINAAVVISKGKILGAIPKTYIPNYGEFYEKRWFSSSKDLKETKTTLLDQELIISPNILFRDKAMKEITFAVEICEDLWAITPPSNNHCLYGATIIFNLSSSNEVIGKNEYRHNLVAMQSAKTISSYVYCSSGLMESSSDLVFSGAAIIYENGTELSHNKLFNLESNLIYSDIDVLKLVSDRRKNSSYMGKVTTKDYYIIDISVKDKIKELKRVYQQYPFVPLNEEKRKARMLEILDLASFALARRLLHLKNSKCVIGMSGGLDSTLAFLITLRALEKLDRSPKDIIAVTIPGFGTTDRTYQNALALIKIHGATLKEVNIKEACLLHMKDINLPLDDRSITYENLQARERTQILMDIANMEKGIVIGTGDLSELALGWCTYNGDHMSMYAVNSSIPKTLVRHLVEFCKDQSGGKQREILKDILDTPISPELLPKDSSGNISQKTESSIGPYILHDFFLYHFLRYGVSLKKLYFLAKITFKDSFSNDELKKWLIVFIKRFTTSQFKRNCFPDGIKVGSVSLSPRGDFRMPSDIDTNYEEFLKEL